MESWIRRVIAISVNEMNQWGCPHCGYHAGEALYKSKEGMLWNCLNKKCDRQYVALNEGEVESSISPTTNPMHFPRLQSHPRKGTPAWGKEELTVTTTLQKEEV